MNMKTLICAMFIVLLTVSLAAGAGKEAPEPSKKDKCPVCGMFVAKYPDWIAAIVFKDGLEIFFDGAKDLFKYYFNMVKYDPGRRKADVAAIYVTEYYDVELIDAHAAYFVIGSNVFGPMGRELIPFRGEEDAGGFVRDHGGKAILKFGDINPEVINKLDG